MLKKLYNFFFKKHYKHQPLLEFNQNKLAQDIEKLALRLFDSKNEPAVHILSEYTHRMMSNYLIEMGRMNGPKAEAIAFQQGCVKSCNDLLSFIEQATNVAEMTKYIESKKGKTGKREPMKLVRTHETVI